MPKKNRIFFANGIGTKPVKFEKRLTSNFEVFSLKFDRQKKDFLENDFFFSF